MSRVARLSRQHWLSVEMLDFLWSGLFFSNLSNDICCQQATGLFLDSSHRFDWHPAGAKR